MDTCFELNIRTQMEALISEREAMKAANRQRQGQGFADAYGEDAFMRLAADFTRLNEEIRKWG